jgi:tRNA modification GTPase
LELDTIVAIATPPGIGSIGIIRLSGPQALKIGQKLCPGQSLTTPRYVYFGHIINPITHSALDEACILYFKGPQSYTGEDCVEIQSHGSYFVLQQILEISSHYGARLALPGEFTKRAFLHGKLDLTKAESIIDLIHSTTEKAHAVALSHIQGKLYTRIQACRGQLCRIFEQIEGSIDFPDEVEGINRDEVLHFLDTTCNELGQIIDLQDLGEQVRHGINCVIVGKPNVGKSSLFNTLVGTDRAIVTDIPGTTRDYLEAAFKLGGMTFKLYDTAGVRESDDYIEHLGIEKMQTLLHTADIVMWVVDSTYPFSEEDHRILNLIKRLPLGILLINKSDQHGQLNGQLNLNEITVPSQWPQFTISTKTNQGIETMKQFLYDHFIKKAERVDLSLLCNIRQVTCIQGAITAMDHMKEGVTAGVEDDILALDLKNAILKLGEVTGDEFTEEVLDGIFSRFCVGK